VKEFDCIVHTVNKLAEVWKFIQVVDLALLHLSIFTFYATRDLYRFGCVHVEIVGASGNICIER
jgi:hypothetical protein